MIVFWKIFNLLTQQGVVLSGGDQPQLLLNAQQTFMAYDGKGAITNILQRDTVIRTAGD